MFTILYVYAKVLSVVFSTILGACALKNIYRGIFGGIIIGFGVQVSAQEFVVEAEDAHQRRMLEDVRNVIEWRSRNPEASDVRLMISELGVPTQGPDVALYAQLMEKLYSVFEYCSIDAGIWAAGHWWDQDGPKLDDYPLTIFRQGEVTDDAVTQVYRAYQSTDKRLNIISLAGAEFSLPQHAEDLTTTFDKGLGKINHDYTYHSDGQYGDIWQKIAEAGFSHVRYAFRLELLFDSDNGEFRQDDLRHFLQAIALARKADIKLFLDPHNYGAILVPQGDVFVLAPLGSDAFPVYLYHKMLAALGALAQDNDDVVDIVSIMTEPVNVPTSVWPTYVQGAVDAVRAGGFTGYIKWPTASWQGITSPLLYHPDGPVSVIDPLDRIAVGVHLYMDLHQSGWYSDSYEQDEIVLARTYDAGPVTFDCL